MNDIIPLISSVLTSVKMPMVAHWQGFHKVVSGAGIGNESSGKLWLAGHISGVTTTTVPDEGVAARLNDRQLLTSNYVILLWSLVIKMSNRQGYRRAEN